MVDHCRHVAWGAPHQDDRNGHEDHASREGANSTTTATTGGLDSWKSRPQPHPIIGGVSFTFLRWQPNGHSVGGGLLGPIPRSGPPPVILQGMHLEHSIQMILFLGRILIRLVLGRHRKWTSPNLMVSIHGYGGSNVRSISRSMESLS